MVRNWRWNIAERNVSVLRFVSNWEASGYEVRHVLKMVEEWLVDGLRSGKKSA